MPGEYLLDTSIIIPLFRGTQLACDAETAQHYGRIKQGLRRRGRPIPENDLWIAATALQHQLVLVTRDDHFYLIEGLATERW